jgi:hypothetical protein
VVAWEASSRRLYRPDVDLVQLTHLVARPEGYGLALVQERDRIGRCSLAGRWVWRRELRAAVEDVAVGPLNLTAFTTDDGRLTIADAAGEDVASTLVGGREPLLLVEAPSAGRASGVAWITLARHEQILRGHSPEGAVVWESPTPWEAWGLQLIGRHLMVSAPDGRLLAYDEKGYLIAQSGADPTNPVLAVGPGGAPVRLVRRERQLLCEDLSGRTLWRSLGEQPFGPVAGASWGVAALLEKQLVAFRHPGGLEA